MAGSERARDPLHGPGAQATIGCFGPKSVSSSGTIPMERPKSSDPSESETLRGSAWAMSRRLIGA